MFDETQNRQEILRRTAARFQRITNKIVRMSQAPQDFGTGEALPAAEIQIIHAVGINPGISVTDLSSQLGLTKGTVSPMVNRLAKREYLTKEKSGQDGRKVRLEITSKGETAFKGYEKYAEEYIAQYAHNISFGEWIIVNETLTKLENFVDMKLKEDQK